MSNDILTLLAAFKRSTTSIGKQKDKITTSSVPSLYPVYLPFQTQHNLLVTVQQALERACYEFARNSMPEVVKQEGWECAESVELNLWARACTARLDKFEAEAVEDLGKPLQELFDSLAQLRHTAVHRVRISANRLEVFMVDAESCAKLLDDSGCF